ncbi:RloB family protein [Streptomyces kebangsaanensis]|uniref:RloB family protein n=1 Tax=Streptomyces kebangsaanensis TaxID=864058 RepID=A0ABW6KPR2_9ACTN
MARQPKPDGRRIPRRESTLRRRPAHREPLPPILVVCGAKNTEPAYLRGLLASVDNRAVDVKIRICAQDPVSVVRHTATERDKAGDHYHRAWCVLDVDEFAHLNEALRLAEAENVEVALSNPCFELWLLLHHRAHHAPVAGYQQAKRHLVTHHPGYSKAAREFDFGHYRARWPDAVEHARKLAKPGEEAKVNPSSGMWRLIQEIVPAHLQS